MMNDQNTTLSSLIARFLVFSLCIIFLAEGELVPSPFLKDVQRVGFDSTRKHINKRLFYDIYGIAMVKPRNKKTNLLVASDPMWCRLIYTSVYIYFPTPKYLRQFGGCGVKNAEFLQPRGICIDTTIYKANADEYYIYVADSKNNRISSVKYCIPKERIVEDTILISSLHDPRDVACVTANNGGAYIVVAERDTHRIMLYHRDSVGIVSLIQAYGSRGSRYGQFFQPSGVAICPANDSSDGFLIYVADTENRRVVCLHFDIMDGITWQYEYRTMENAHFLSVAVDQNYNVYVTDYIQNKIWVFTYTLKKSYTYGGSQLFNKPRDICIDGENLIVTESWTGTTGIQSFKIIH
jgi:sugar lactone lactonase YvrE